MENNQDTLQPNNQNARTIAVVALILLALSVGTGIYFWKKAHDASLENSSLTENVHSLEATKTRIEHELDSLSMAYGSLRTENEDLRGKEASTAALIAQKDAAINQIKAKKQRELGALKKQVEELQHIKVEYETLITAVKQENEQLKEENQRLLGENQHLQKQNSDLSGQVDDFAKKLEEQIRKTQSAKFKASSFRVEVGRRNEKVTARAKKAKEITVSFDLMDVPEKYQGEQHLYLVLRDNKGIALASTNPIKTTIETPTGNMPITAQQVKAVSLGETQRLSFNYKLDDRIKGGNYTATIYCNVGLLGGSSFRLN